MPRPGQEIETYEAKGVRILFRYPKWDDVRGVLACAKAMYEEAESGGELWLPTPQLDLAGACDQVARQLKALELGTGVHITAERDGRIVGAGSVSAKSGQFGQGYGTLGLHLLREVRGLGAGRRLMELLEQEARAHLDLRAIYLTVSAANPAMHLYAKCGYREIGRKPHFVAPSCRDIPFEERADIVDMALDL